MNMYNIQKYLGHYLFLINLEELVQILKQKVLNYCTIFHISIYLFVYWSNIIYSIFQANQMQFKVKI